MSAAAREPLDPSGAVPARSGPAPGRAGDHPLTIHKDETGVIRGVDEATAAFFGWHPADMIGRRSLEFIHPQDHDTAMINWVQLLGAPGSRYGMRIRHCDAAGSWAWFEVTNHNLLADPDRRAVVTELVPLAEPPPVPETSWVSNQLLRRLTASLPLGVLQVDPAGRVVFSNERLATVVGTTAAGGVDAVFARVDTADRAGLEHALAAVLAGTDSDIEVALDHPELGPRRCGLRLRALTDQTGNEVTGALLCVLDVTEEARRRAEIEHRATYDALTHCLNRASILAALGDLLDPGEQDGRHHGLAVYFLDLDRFKPINDDYGHAIGDRLLQHVALRLRTAARESDLVGRLGGDEFLLVCPGVDNTDTALALAGRVAAAIHQPVDLGVITVVPSASIGIALGGQPGQPADDPAALVARADAAMYQSKRDRAGAPVLAVPPG